MWTGRQLIALSLLVAVGLGFARRAEPVLLAGAVIEVVGAVPSPGFHLVAEPTVASAVVAAGGACEGDVGLAEGARVIVTRGGATVGRGSDPLLLGGRVDVNRDGAEALRTLPGIGAVAAAAVIAERERDGPFRSVDALVRARGVGPVTVARVRDLVTVGDVPPAPDAEPIDLDRADARALERLPGIGPVLAARIVADRERRGSFRGVDGLSRVRGIGPATVARIRREVATR
jgi:competence protein ComEA